MTFTVVLCHDLNSFSLVNNPVFSCGHTQSFSFHLLLKVWGMVSSIWLAFITSFAKGWRMWSCIHWDTRLDEGGGARTYAGYDDVFYKRKLYELCAVRARPSCMIEKRISLRRSDWAGYGGVSRLLLPARSTLLEWKWRYSTVVHKPSVMFCSLLTVLWRPSV